MIKILNKIGSMLGRTVETEDGIGVAIGVNTPCNGLYFEPERSTVLVWYGVCNESSDWVTRTYHYSAVHLIKRKGCGR